MVLDNRQTLRYVLFYDFITGDSSLRADHKVWIEDFKRHNRPTGFIYMWGLASPLWRHGHNSNRELSNARLVNLISEFSDYFPPDQLVARSALGEIRAENLIRLLEANGLREQIASQTGRLGTDGSDTQNHPLSRSVLMVRSQTTVQIPEIHIVGRLPRRRIRNIKWRIVNPPITPPSLAGRTDSAPVGSVGEALSALFPLLNQGGIEIRIMQAQDAYTPSVTRLLNRPGNERKGCLLIVWTCTSDPTGYAPRIEYLSSHSQEQPLLDPQSAIRAYNGASGVEPSCSGTRQTWYYWATLE